MFNIVITTTANTFSSNITTVITANIASISSKWYHHQHDDHHQEHYNLQQQQCHRQQHHHYKLYAWCNKKASKHSPDRMLQSSAVSLGSKSFSNRSSALTTKQHKSRLKQNDQKWNDTPPDIGLLPWTHRWPLTLSTAMKPKKNKPTTNMSQHCARKILTC